MIKIKINPNLLRNLLRPMMKEASSFLPFLFGCCVKNLFPLDWSAKSQPPSLSSSINLSTLNVASMTPAEKARK
jgi:ABC-type microcin C transport system permease subunit YejE